jgi:hypothetical protein
MALYGRHTWFEDYFPEIRRNDFRLLPAAYELVRTISAAAGRSATISRFPLPADVIDRFMYAPWNRPEAYLDPTFRANTSGFASADPDILKQRLSTLRNDIESGAWDARYGNLRTATAFDAGYYFVALRTP